MHLISDILDLPKMEFGTPLRGRGGDLLRPPAESVARHVPPLRPSGATSRSPGGRLPLNRGIVTDLERLQQVLHNLLSNAFKFTEDGKVGFASRSPAEGWTLAALHQADRVLAFSVSDTGIGIAADKLGLIFEPFQQAEMGTGRKYGGSGLGLSISREPSLTSWAARFSCGTVGQGSTFTLYLPQRRPVVGGG